MVAVRPGVRLLRGGAAAAIVIPPSDVSGEPPIRRISEIYPAPTLVDGRPADWRPSSTVDEPWGYVRILVAGADVTKVRGVRTDLQSLLLQEHFGEGPMVLQVPGASLWDFGRPGFEWMAEEKTVEVLHVDPDGAYVRHLWCGLVTSVDYSGGWTLACDGAFAGPAAMVPHRPFMADRSRDIGGSISRAIGTALYRNGRNRAIGGKTIGILTRDRGSRNEKLIEYVTRLLGMAQTAAGDQWTLGRTGVPFGYELRLKDRTTVQVTLTAGARGVTPRLRRDLSQVDRVIFGEGVNVDGGRWRGAVLPNVGKETVPTYPGAPLTIGTTGDAVRIWQLEVLSDGHGPVGSATSASSGVFAALEAEAAKRIQRLAGLPVTGVVDEATWDATWSNGRADLNLGSAAFMPIAADPRTPYWLYSSNGSVLAANPDFDGRVLPVGRMLSYGQGVSKADGTRDAQRIITQNATPAWYGEITIDGTDPEEMSRLAIEEGMNARLKWFGGVEEGIGPLHIAGVRWTRSGPSWSVTLTVDEQARDLLTLAEIMKRDRDSQQDPVRQAISQLRKSAQVRDTPGAWDSEAGFGMLPPRDCSGGAWNVFTIAGGQYGNLSRILLQTTPAVRFCVALFGARPSVSFLNGAVPAPLADPGDTDYLVWDKPSIQAGLRYRLFIEAFGGFNNGAGYSPGYETHPASGKPTGHPVTGKLDVDSGTNYALAAEPALYVAVWPEDACSIVGEIRLLPNE